MSYKDLWKAIIRPPRDNYQESDLGEKIFDMLGRKYERTDFELTSVQGLKIVASHYEPIEFQRVSPIMPCVIYLHGNCGSRIEAMSCIFLLTGGITLVSLDFPGCGMSEGEYLTLGWYEQFDLANLIDYLRVERRVGDIGLWGRSMGAVTSILYISSNPKLVKAIVLDSPFANLKKLSINLAKKYSKSLPKFMLKIAYSFIRRTIKKKVGTDVCKLKPIKSVNNIAVPTVFAYSLSDELVPVKQFALIESAFSVPVKTVVLEGGHNGERDLEFLKSVGVFFVEKLGSNNLRSNPINIPPHLVNDDVRREMDEMERNRMEYENSHRDLYSSADYCYTTLSRKQFKDKDSNGRNK